MLLFAVAVVIAVAAQCHTNWGDTCIRGWDKRVVVYIWCASAFIVHDLIPDVIMMYFLSWAALFCRMRLLRMKTLLLPKSKLQYTAYLCTVAACCQGGWDRRRAATVLQKMWLQQKNCKKSLWRLQKENKKLYIVHKMSLQTKNTKTDSISFMPNCCDHTSL